MTKEWWRRVDGEGEYAKMLATRLEMQIAGDWMCVPASRNLHGRCTVLHSCFFVCERKVGPGKTVRENIERISWDLWRK